MNTLVFCVALAAVSASALSPNRQVLDSWMSKVKDLEASIATEGAYLNFVPVSRVARNADMKDFLTKSCCGSEELKFDHVQEYVDQCKDKDGEKAACMKCVGEAAGVADAEGKITDADKFTNTVSEMYSDDELKAKVKEVSAKCIEKANGEHGTEGKNGHNKIAILDAFMCFKMEVDM
ncbi:hypothetical protein L9F63_003449, partial [Diploptera punctata]